VELRITELTILTLFTTILNVGDVMVHDEFLDDNDSYFTCSRTLSVKLDIMLLAKMDYLIKHYKFPSRSDFIRNAIMFKINQLRVKGLIGGK